MSSYELSGAQPTPSPNVIKTRSNRLVRPRVFSDTMSGEWWKRSRAQTSNSWVELSDVFNTTKEDSALVSILEIPEPKRFYEAKSSIYWSEWERALEDEILSLKENNVWHVVPCPKGRKIVNGKWGFKVKGNVLGEVERFKAPYVAKGFTQVQGLDYEETFAPVVRLDSLRLLLAISSSRRCSPRQLDVKTAFLYGTLNEEIYMQLPEEFRIDNQVARLNRCIYGLEQSPREWYFRLCRLTTPDWCQPNWKVG